VFMISVHGDDDWWTDDDVWWLNYGDDDQLSDNDNGIWWLNLYVMVDELRIIMICSVIWISNIYALNMIFEYYILYMYMMVFVYTLTIKLYIILLYLFLVSLPLCCCMCYLSLMISYLMCVGSRWTRGVPLSM